MAITSPHPVNIDIKEPFNRARPGSRVEGGDGVVIRRERLYDIREVARLLGKSETTILNWIDEHLEDGDLCLQEGKKRVRESGFQKLATICGLLLKQPGLVRAMARSVEKKNRLQELQLYVGRLERELEELRQDNQGLMLNLELEQSLRRQAEERLVDQTRLSEELRLKEEELRSLEERLNREAAVHREELLKEQELVRRAQEQMQQLILARDEALQLGQEYCDRLREAREQLEWLQQQLNRRRLPWWKRAAAPLERPVRENAGES